MAPNPFIVAVRVSIAVIMNAPSPTIAHTFFDAVLALLRGVDEEDAAKRPPGQATKAVPGRAVQQDDPLAGIEELERRNHAREPATDDDDVSLVLSVSRHEGRPSIPGDSVGVSDSVSASVDVSRW